MFSIGRSLCRVLVLCAAALSLLLSPINRPAHAANEPLVVGAHIDPPFVIRDAEGEWSGVSIDLWRDVASQLNLNYEFREMPAAQLIANLQSGACDVALDGEPMTAARDAEVDCTCPFYAAGLGIAIRRSSRFGLWDALPQLISLDVLSVVLATILLVLASGVVVWFFERRQNVDHFGEDAWSGIGNGVWWAAVTLSTVGYGDKTPKSVAGRLVALLWMFAGLVILSLFTATIASHLTISQLQTRVRGVHDLPHVRVAAVADSTSIAYLRRKGLAPRAFLSAEAAIAALRDNAIDAVVCDSPSLRYLAQHDATGAIVVLPGQFDQQSYAWMLPDGSPLRKPLNLEILRITAAPRWEEEVLRFYLGN